jgi:16S rRNA processing protein RimM
VREGGAREGGVRERSMREGRVPASGVVLGEVIGAHGTRGELRVAIFGDGPANLLRAPELILGAPPEHADRIVRVQSAVAGRPGEVRLTLHGVDSREAAQALAGLRVSVEPRHLEPLPSGEFYWYQLVGCAVEAHDGRALGTVRALLETGAHDVLVVEDADGQEVLLPTAGDLLREVDVARGRIVIEVPDGLLDPV